MNRIYFIILKTALLISASLLIGCAGLANRATQRFANTLTAGILNQDDIATARDGVPAYLLLLDGLIESDPHNMNLLMAGAQLYGAYSDGFVEEPQRAQRLAGRSFNYARRALCAGKRALCQQLNAPFDVFQTEVHRTRAADVPLLYILASSWASYIQANSDDWKAIADIPKVQALLDQVVRLAPAHAKGEPYMYLGVLATLRPASLGGEPEKGKANFEKAISLSGGNNHMMRVYYAKYYARLVFDRELHDTLLHEVLSADPHAPGLTLINTLAQQRAKALLDSGNDYF